MNPPLDDAGTLLMELTGLGVEVQANGDGLRFRPRSALTPDLVERLKTHKPEILAILRDGQRVDGEGSDDAGTEIVNGVAIRFTPEATAKDRAIARAIANDADKSTRAEPIGDCPVKVPEGWRPDRWAAELRIKADACDELHAATADQWRRMAYDIECWLGVDETLDASFDFGSNTAARLRKETRWTLR
jgi:TubC N-terminal docking domain